VFLFFLFHRSSGDEMEPPPFWPDEMAEGFFFFFGSSNFGAAAEHTLAFFSCRKWASQHFFPPLRFFPFSRWGPQHVESPPFSPSPTGPSTWSFFFFFFPPEGPLFGGGGGGVGGGPRLSFFFLRTRAAEYFPPFRKLFPPSFAPTNRHALAFSFFAGSGFRRNPYFFFTLLPSKFFFASAGEPFSCGNRSSRFWP